MFCRSAMLNVPEKNEFPGTAASARLREFRHFHFPAVTTNTNLAIGGLRFLI